MGCTEVTNLRKDNASLREQLRAAEARRDQLLSEREAFTAERSKQQTELATAQARAKQMDQLVTELKADQQRLAKQKQDLVTLLQNYGPLVETRAEGNFIVMESDVLFASGKADLNPDAKKALDKVAQYLVDHPEQGIRIDGHTDAVPIKVSGWLDNYHLGAMRAHAVMEYLVSKNVAPERMFITGMGPNQPRMKPQSPEQPVAQNRRVEILLVAPSSQRIEQLLESFKH
jgi:chemotaxis protein MotB